MSCVHLRLILRPSRFLRSYSKYLTTIHQQRSTRKGEALKIRLGELMPSWVYGEKFSTGMQFLLGMLLFTVEEDDDLEHRLKNEKSSTWRRPTSSFLKALETLQLRSSDQESVNSSSKYPMIGKLMTFNAARLR
jgi:hypothetical protein